VGGESGLDALDIAWNPGPNGHVDTAQVWREIKEASEKPGLVAKKTGDTDKALAAATGSRRSTNFRSSHTPRWSR